MAPVLSSSLEQKFLQHCSPTFAKIKASSLFKLSFKSLSEKHKLEAELRSLTQLLDSQGFKLFILQTTQKYIQVLLYHHALLEQLLQKAEIKQFLASYSYHYKDSNEALEQLKMRVHRSKSFPHEIGVFLAYPLNEVQAFIQHHSCPQAASHNNPVCAGAWRVFCDKNASERCFMRYRRCTRCLCELHLQGHDLSLLIACARKAKGSPLAIYHLLQEKSKLAL